MIIQTDPQKFILSGAVVPKARARVTLEAYIPTQTIPRVEGECDRFSAIPTKQLRADE